MLEMLWLIPALPLAGSMVLAMTGASLPQRAIAWIGAGSVGLSALLALLLAGSFVLDPPAGHAYLQVLWGWLRVDSFASQVSLYLDPLSILMVLVITVVGFLIHLYSTEYMARDEGYNRYFCYLNLFIASMLALVLAGDLLFLFLGWEGVGLCSYLLIGFWYRDAANGEAARKAFIVTRIGDAAMAVGLFLIFTDLGTLDIQRMLARAAVHWPGTALATTAAALLLAGALGKSAQLPLQTWLPDAMAGPTPVSALIHAATMVTAGVYLIARLHLLYSLAPVVQFATSIIGALTLLLAGLSALMQRDIKRVLAYSTMSQIGYMFLALGLGAWQAAMFHFVTHAAFKALLFLAAGVVIHALDGEHDIFRMGGLRRQLPLAFWSFLIGGASLSGLPLITAGFYSKDLIIWSSIASTSGAGWLWAAAWAGAFLTSTYTFRLIFRVFFGPQARSTAEKTGAAIRLPLVILGALSLVVGFVKTPPTLGGINWFSEFLAPVLNALQVNRAVAGLEIWFELLSTAAAIGGLYLAYQAFLLRRPIMQKLASIQVGAVFRRWLEAGWGFDLLYRQLVVRPFLMLARGNGNDVIDAFYAQVASATRAAHLILRGTVNGRLRWYATGVAAGAVALLGIGIWL